MSGRANLALVPSQQPGVLLSDGLPADLREALQRGGGILLLGRNSNSGGAVSRRTAVGNCLDAAALLAHQGIELRHLLPSARELEDRLLDSAANIDFTDSKNRRRRIRSIQVHPAPGVVLVIQQGTGVSRPKGKSFQPAAARVAEAVRDVVPVLLAAMEVRSTTRSGYAWDPIVEAIEDQIDAGGIFYYTDSRLPIAAFNRQVRKHIFDEGELALDEAKKIRERMLRGARRNTDRMSRGGRFRYGFGGVLPPPLDTVRLKNSAGASGEMWAVLDCPECRFLESEVAMGRGQPDPGSGHLARPDQVALVRWFYEHYLQPGWPQVKVARYLIDNGFSSPGARRYHQDSQARQQLNEDTLTTDAAAICDIIVDHMDFHVTGDLMLPLNEDGSLVAVHLEHPDGLPLCSEEDRARIEAAQAVTSRDGAPRRLFSGHPATVNGKGAWLVSVKDDGSGDLKYAFAKDIGKKRRQMMRHHVPYLPHRTLFEAIAGAANGTDLWPSTPTRDKAATFAADELLAQRKSELRRLQSDLAGLQVTLDREDRTGHAKKRTTDMYNDTAARLAQADRDLAAAQRARDRLNVETGLHVNEWFPFLRSIHDPRDTTYRDKVTRDLGPLTVTTRNAPTPEHPGRVVLDFEAEMALLDSEGTVMPILIQGTSERLANGPATDTVRGTVALLRSGVPMTEIHAGDKGHLGRLVRASLGHGPGSQCRILTTRDPRLTALSMAACHPEDAALRLADSPPDPDALVAAELHLGGSPLPPQALWRLADSLGEPRSLLRHLVALHEVPPIDDAWFGFAAPTAQRTLSEAALHPVRRPQTWVWMRVGSFLERCDGGYVAVACPHCGNRARRLPRLVEMVGLVCPRCRRDDSGVSWPADPYDRYLNSV